MSELGKISLVIPAYNEAGLIGHTSREAAEFLAAHHPDCEIIVVDDGSTDGTADVVRDCLLSYPTLELLSNARNLGKGGAVRRGMLQASGDYVFFMDADLSVPMEEMTKFLRVIRSERPDVVIGSRKMAGAEIRRHQPPLRELLGKGFTLLANVLLVGGITDFTCGFKAFSRPAATAVFSRVQRVDWSFDAEALYLAHRLGYSVRQVPVVWENRAGTRVRLLRDVARSLWGLLSIRCHAGQEAPGHDSALAGSRPDLGRSKR